jgi:hypothetical protein
VAGVEGLGRARHVGLITDPRPSGNPPRRQLDDAPTSMHQSIIITLMMCGISHHTWKLGHSMKDMVQQ